MTDTKQNKLNILTITTCMLIPLFGIIFTGYIDNDTSLLVDTVFLLSLNTVFLYIIFIVLLIINFFTPISAIIIDIKNTTYIILVILNIFLLYLTLEYIFSINNT